MQYTNNYKFKKPDILYYCRDVKSYFFVREINGSYSYSAFSYSRNETLNPTI